MIADGGWSSLRSRYFAPAGSPEYAGHQVWRFRVEAKHVPGFQAYGAFESGHYFSIMLDISFNDGRQWIMGGTAIAAEESAVVRPAPGGSRQAPPEGNSSTPPPAWFLPFFETKFAHAAGGELVRVMRAAAAHGKISPALPQYEYAAPRVVAGRLVLLGDAAHMASPRTGAGAHTAVLDAAALGEAFAGAARSGGGGGGGGGGAPGALVDRALAAYAPPAVQRAAALVARSRQLSAAVAAPGWRRQAAPRDDEL